MTLDSEFEQILGQNAKRWNSLVESLARDLCFRKGDDPDIQLADANGWTSCWECYRNEAETFLANKIMQDHYDSNFEMPHPR